MPMRSQFVAVLVAALSLSSVAGAGAATIKTKHPAKVTIPSLKVTKKATGTKTTTTTTAKSTSVAAVRPGGGIVVKPISTGPAVAAISAYPTGGKGSGTEATCALWTDQLQEDEGAIADADNKAEAAQNLADDVNNALDAGCFVIY